MPNGTHGPAPFPDDLLGNDNVVVPTNDKAGASGRSRAGDAAPSVNKSLATPLGAPAAPLTSVGPKGDRQPIDDGSVQKNGITADGEPAMPHQLREEFKRIEVWAQANNADARRDALRFWSLKIPAILVSATTGVFAFYGLKNFVVLAGAVSSFCVLMDGLKPSGNLRNVHLRAVNDLRILQHNMLAQWDQGVLRGGVNPNLLAAEAIAMSAKEKQRINNYITQAETSLGTSGRSVTVKNR